MASKHRNFSKIEDNIYLGNEETALDKEFLQKLKIKRIITILNQEIKYSNKVSGIFYKYISAEDKETEDLISYFPECFQFIFEGQSYGENVLIHCRTGVSRSATIVISFLMKKYGLSADVAVQRVLYSRLCINPNLGFINQLKLWQKMSYTLDSNNSEFHELLFLSFRFKLHEILVQNQENSSELYLEKFRDYLQKLMIAEEYRESLIKGKTYSCLKCGNHLFNEINVFKNDEQYECKSIYIEPNDWVLEYIEKNSNIENYLTFGNISCCKCSAILGRYDFSKNNMKCECLVHIHLDYYSVFKIFSNKVKTEN